MVQVTGFKTIRKKDGTSFVALELTGSVQLIQNSSGKVTAVVQKCRIPSNLTEETAKMVIGSKIDGEVVKVQSEPYEYLNKNTGEVMQLQHTYSFRPPNSMELLGNTRIGELQGN